MKARELASILLLNPDRLVQVDTPGYGVWVVTGADLDQFNDEEGPSVVLCVKEER